MPNKPGNNQVSDKPRCGVKLKRATKNNPEGRCRRFPVQYAKVCPRHGGKLPVVKIAAEKARLNEQIGKAAQRLGVADPVTDPLRALQQLSGEVVQWKNL